MAQLSESELDIIKANPIKDEFKTLLATFKSTYSNAKVVDSPAAYEKLLTDPAGKGLALRFIGTLQLLPASSALPSRYGLGPLSGDIALLYSGLSSGQTNINFIAGLLHAVVIGEDDQKIWAKLYEIIARTRPTPQPTTPPQSQPSFTSSFQQTPWSFNTGSFADASEHRRQVDDALREELLPTLRIDVPDFIPAVFGHISRLDELAEMVFDRCQEEDTRLYTKGSGWTEWPMNAKEDLVLDWLHNLMKRFVAWMNSVHPATSRQIYKGPSAYLDGSPIKRKMDVGIMGRHENKDDEVDEKTGPKSSWVQILVAGELKSNPIEDGQESAWLDLATYAREVFRTQDRRFVLGFTLCGSRMRLWHFDRSGSSGSSSFDINQEGLKFVHVMLGYHLMNDKQLGLDPTIQQLDGQRFVEITRDDQIERLILTKEIRKQAVVAGRATTCWRAYCDKDQSKEPLVVKDSWQYEERPEEGELIKEATDKGARNIARYYHHETVQVDGKNDDTIDNVRRGSMKTFVRTRFRQRPLNESDASASASDSPRKTIAGRTQSPSLSRKRSSSTAQMAPPASFKRSCSSFESWNSGSPIHNRVHRRVITRDFGKPIYEASSPSALITGLIGAIKGHESLLNSGILHRDVSVGNIMLTENEDDGFLIDYDLAIRTSNDRASGAPGKTGTKVFMAIGALLGEPHSFMHDLESFFWVLFWICIHYEGRNEKGEVKRRIVPQYEDWNYLSTERLANLKAGQISKGIFDTVDDYFTEHCKPLIPCLKELHKAVFVEGSRWFSEHRELYSDMKRILEKARDNIKFEASLVSLLEMNSQIRLKYLAELEVEGTLSSKPPQSSSMAGTKIFMAIGALKGEHHNTMHDLESFFWVLFWICIHWNGPSRERRKVKEFEEWNKESTQKLANIKIGMVSEEDGFDKEMSENFSEYCKPLVPCVQELRKVVFPGGKRRLSEDMKLFAQMDAVLEKGRLDVR